jgi:hypothetical protein
MASVLVDLIPLRPKLKTARFISKDHVLEYMKNIYSFYSKWIGKVANVI